MFDTSVSDPFANLSVEDKQELLLMLQERRRNRAPTVQVPEVCVPSKAVILPRWNGKQEDFGFYMDMLRTRVEKEMADCRESSSLCIDIINTLPEEKRSRVANWFSLSKKKDKFDWQNLLEVFEREFEDTQAQQAATELVQRMEQGRHQYFHEFLKEFEYKVALSGGDEIYTQLAKTRQLKLSLNNNLRRALIGVKLPSEKQYAEWVAAVKEVAIELESFTDYRPKGSNHMGTKIGPPKSGSTMSKLEPSQPDSKVDGNGDTFMTGTDAILAAIKDLQLQNKDKWRKKSKKTVSRRDVSPSKRKDKPRAPWRSSKEFARLIEEGVCIRCGKGGHKGPDCSVYRRAIRPKGDLSQLEENSSDEAESDSGNDDA